MNRNTLITLLVISILLFGCNFKKKGNNPENNLETESGKLTCFQIGKQSYKGLDIFTLDGGMSAEYVVEKAAENITGGISHSWKVNAPGSGPNHVYATPQFLEKSVNYTVDFYNKVLGDNSEFETVIISPGIPSVPYISNALKAPVLPLHFLVSTNSVKEVQSILEYSNQKKYSSYATLSHDPSVPYAVAWVKLLDIPKPYLDFIKQHKVKNVLILGATGNSSGGETKSKKIITGNNSEDYLPNDIYIMYPGTSLDDVKTLNEKISDLKDFNQQDEFIHIADWESGITEKQIDNFRSTIQASVKGAKTIQITSDDLNQLYNLGTTISVAYMHKNRKQYQGQAIQGVIFNPYLVSHPTYEMKSGYIPVVYWQLIPPQWTIDRLKNMANVIDFYFPETDFKKLNYWVNSSRNFGGVWSAESLEKTLIENGYKKLKTNDYTKDEVWNPEDGMEAISEIIAKEITNTESAKSFKEWNSSLQPLSLSELEKIIDQTGGIAISVK